MGGLYSEQASARQGECVGGQNQFQIIAPLNNCWPCLSEAKMINDDTTDNGSKTHRETLLAKC